MYFGDESVVGGAERYSIELARAMADAVSTTLISFGPKRRSYRTGRLRVELFPARLLHGQRERPLSAHFLPWLLDADVVHCHNLGSPSTAVTLLFARLLRKPRFVTPLGLLPTRAEHRMIRLAGLSGLLCISEFSARESRTWYRAPDRVIYGGVDTEVFRPMVPRERKFVCVARIVPHKGINYLIEALDPDMRLEVYGRPYDERYYRDLQRLARGKDVTFYTDASDDRIVRAYSGALAAVLPSVYTDMYGGRWAHPELLGLVLLEGMACGTAVVGTRAGAIPEYIEEGRTGYLVPPNDHVALRAALRRLQGNPSEAEQLGRNGYQLVREKFTWQAVAERYLSAYDSLS